jgi:hypothetical protein
MLYQNVEMTIVINAAKDHSAREFVSPMDRQTYIEGRDGSNFSIRLHNKNAFRVLAIPSVDGVSILDGEPAGEQSPGYILDAQQTLDIPGWVVDGDTAAKFFFASTKSDGTDSSYVAQSGGDTANKGVIGLMVFREKYTPPAFTGGFHKGILRNANSRSYSFNGSNTLLGSRSMMAPTPGLYNMTTSCAADSVADSADAANWVATASAGISFDSVEPEPETQLGTGFGEATSFTTKKVDFDRGDLLCVMVIYYKDARGLKKVGIDVSQPIRRSPSAFPADKRGCKPPVGWNG